MRLVTTILAVCCAALLSLGFVILFSVSQDFRPGGTAMLQLVWGGIGLLAAGVVAAMPYRFFQRVSWVGYAVAVVLLAWVLFRGEAVNGARRWLSYGGLSFQPSEFAKLALIVTLAHYGARHQAAMTQFWRGLVWPGVLILVVLGLIFKEPDWGTTLLLAAVSGVILLVAGVRWAHVVPICVVAVVALALVLLHNPLRLRRLDSWLRPEATREDVGYQAYHAKLAIGSGGWTGKGLGNGEYYGKVPIHQTDFILAPLGEELGLASTLSVVCLFVAFVGCGLTIAWRARDVFGLLLATGLTSLIALQALINIGVVTGLLPNKGLALPFLSRGGSNLLMMLVGVGMLLSIARCTARDESSEEPLPDLEEAPAVPSS